MAEPVPEAGRGRHVDEEVGVAGGPVPPRGPGTRPASGRLAVVRAAADADVVGEDQPGGVAVGRVREGRAAPLHADLTGEVRVGLDDARLDDHLRGLRIQVADQVLDRVAGS